MHRVGFRLDRLALLPPPRLQGERVTLRAPQESDADDRLRHPIGPGEENQTHLHPCLPRLPVTAAQQAKPVRPQVTTHIPATGHRLTGNNAPRRLLIGCLEASDEILSQAPRRRGRKSPLPTIYDL